VLIESLLDIIDPKGKFLWYLLPGMMGLFLTAIMAISEWIIAAIVTGFVTLFMQLIWLIYLGDKKNESDA
jgi:hypothetical protein